MSIFISCTGSRRDKSVLAKMILLLATILMTTLSTGLKMPLGISRSVAGSGGRSESFSLPKMQLQVNILRRRVKLDVPSSVILPQQLMLLADRSSASDQKIEENHNPKKYNPRFKLKGNTNVLWWLKAAKQASLSIIHSRRKLQSSSGSSCVDQSSFITFVNHNVRDCSWVQATGNCETYGEYCPATCNLCSGTQTGSVNLQQVLNSNIQNQAPASTPTTASVTNSESIETSNGSSNLNGTAVKVSSNQNATPTPTPLHANTGLIGLSQTSGVVVVSLSFTTLTYDQRERLKANKMSIEEILTDLVTADDVLSVNSTSKGRKVLEAIVTSVTQILNADTSYFVSDGANTTSENDAVVSMIYSPSSYNNSMANDGENGWVQLHIPYDTTLTSSRRQLQSAAIKKVKSTCSQDINNRIGDGTLLEMLQLSTNTLIKDVSVFGKEDMATVSSATNTQTGPESVGHQTSSLLFFAVGVCALILFALLVFTVYFIVEKSLLRKHASWVNDDANRVILELDLENGEFKKTTNQKNDQTLDMSLKSGSLSSPPSSGELSESRDRFEPIVHLSKATELSDISCCSSKSGRLGSVATTKFSNRRLSSADRRQPQRKKSATDKSDSETELKQQQTQTAAKRSLFNVPAVGLPFAANNRKNNSDVESTSDSIIDKILRRCKKNVGDEPSAVMSSNYSSWGDDELGSELMKVEEMVLVDPPQEDIDDSLSVHFVDVQGEEYDFSLRKYVDDAFDAIYNSAIDIDTGVVSTRNWEHNDASIISDSSIDETQSTSSSDYTKDSTTGTQCSSTRPIDINASGIKTSEEFSREDANATYNNCEKHNNCAFDSIAATAQHCCEYFDSNCPQETQKIDQNKTSENNNEIGGKHPSTGVQQTANDMNSVSGINDYLCCDLFESSSAHGITVNVTGASIRSSVVDETIGKKANVISGEEQSTCVTESVSGITEYLTLEFISEVISDFSKDPRELAVCGKKLLAPPKDDKMHS